MLKEIVDGGEGFGNWFVGKLGGEMGCGGATDGASVADKVEWSCVALGEFLRVCGDGYFIAAEWVDLLFEEQSAGQLFDFVLWVFVKLEN